MAVSEEATTRRVASRCCRLPGATYPLTLGGWKVMDWPGPACAVLRASVPWSKEPSLVRLCSATLSGVSPPFLLCLSLTQRKLWEAQLRALSPFCLPVEQSSWDGSVSSQSAPVAPLLTLWAVRWAHRASGIKLPVTGSKGNMCPRCVLLDDII